MKTADSSPSKTQEKSDEDPLKIDGLGKANDTPAHLKEYADEGPSPVGKLPATRINKNAAEACKRLSFSLTQCANGLPGQSPEKAQVPM